MNFLPEYETKFLTKKKKVLSEKQKQDVLEKPKMYLCEKKVSRKLVECTYFR